MKESYQTRWDNAVTIASRINELMRQGYAVLDESGTRVSYPFVIDEKGIQLPVGENTSIAYFEKDLNLDGGYYTPIAEFNQMFADWTAVHPKDMKKVF